MLPFSRNIKENDVSSINQEKKIAKSPFVKMTVRSIKPTRPIFKLKISQPD